MSAVQVELAVYRARTAARAGNLAEAARLLADLDEPAALDLRARVHAQRGELAEADRCWARVQELTPADEVAAHGRRLIEKIQSGHRRPRPLVTTGRATAVVLVGAVLAGTWLTSNQDVPPPAANEQPRLHQEIEDLRDRLAALDEERATAATRRTRTLDAIAAALTMPGLRAERRADDVRLVFDAALFGPNGVTVNRPGAALLTELGRKLAGIDIRTTVVGHAVAVPGSTPSGGAPIALDRAQAAAEHLARGGNLPLTAFTLVSADQAEGPHPDVARNRTVTLLITPSPL